MGCVLGSVHLDFLVGDKHRPAGASTDITGRLAAASPHGHHQHSSKDAALGPHSSPDCTSSSPDCTTSTRRTSAQGWGQCHPSGEVTPAGPRLCRVVVCAVLGIEGFALGYVPSPVGLGFCLFVCAESGACESLSGPGWARTLGSAGMRPGPLSAEDSCSAEAVAEATADSVARNHRASFSLTAWSAGAEIRVWGPCALPGSGAGPFLPTGLTTGIPRHRCALASVCHQSGAPGVLGVIPSPDP